jgi:hypothetical protein
MIGANLNKVQIPSPKSSEQSDSTCLREKIIKNLPKSQIGMNTSVGDLIHMNQMLVQYFMENEL